MELHWHGFLIDKLYAFLTYNFAMGCLWCLWGLWEVYEAHRQISSKKTILQQLDMSWCCEVISITHGFVYEVYEPHRQIHASGVYASSNEPSVPYGLFSVKKLTSGRKMHTGHTPYVQESWRNWVFKVGQSQYPKTKLKPL